MKRTTSKIANGEFNDWDDESHKLDMIKRVREGLTYSEFLGFFPEEPFTDSEWANYLGISTRTLDRYRNGKRNFPSKQSERIIEIKRLLNQGVAVFGDRENFMAWLATRSIPLGGIVPKQLLDTTMGIQMVQDQLGRIEHGIFA